MTPKHQLRSSSPSSEPPKKRRHTTGAPSSPFSFSYPSCASDSPSNPFGRTHTWNLLQALPPPTSFSKHLPLRFQYIKRGVPRETLEGIYRVVQVPQSYTLVHLKSLIGFLFGGAYGQTPPDPDNDDETVPGHVFELKDGMSLYPSGFRPGQIMCGTTWTYSSSVLDPYLYYPDWESEDGPSSKAENTEEDVDDERKWTAEEDLTVAHAWPAGGDINRGIVYKHAPNLQIHITINTTPIASRRGKGNLPHVFSACGLVYMEDPAEEDDNLEEEDRTALLDPENWNEPEDAFAKYYRRNTILPLGYEREANNINNSSSASLPSLTFSSSSPLRSSASSAYSKSPSSPFRSSLHVFGFSSPGSGGAFPKHTPAPRPSQRKRIRHMQQRIGALTRMQLRGGSPTKKKNLKFQWKKKMKPMREDLDSDSEDRGQRGGSVEV
ncbi:hypothetical protein MVEN_01372000 [Mycena venus]|uniref:Uncharacterized protein n=1 Tax=Mycena venus TaxID=2733690 RepID=A0A8H6XYI0_9AGAR|nr:hypothetical protein MVEN_01372000 [Mycena venus]